MDLARPPPGPFALVVWVVTVAAPCSPRAAARRRGPGDRPGRGCSPPAGQVAAPAVGLLAAVAVAGSAAGVRGAGSGGVAAAAGRRGGPHRHGAAGADGDPHLLAGAGPPADRGRRHGHPAGQWTGGIRSTTPGPALRASRRAGRTCCPGRRYGRGSALPCPATGNLLVAVLSARGPPTLVGGPGPLQAAAGGLRDGLAASAERVLEAGSPACSPASRSATRAAWTRCSTEEFRRAGLAHLTAVSGANVAIVVACVLWPLRRRAADRRAQAVVGRPRARGLRGARPAGAERRPGGRDGCRRAARAGVRAIAGRRAGAGRRRSSCSPAHPRLAGDAGFALSVVATAAIVLLAPGWSRRLRDPRVAAAARRRARRQRCRGPGHRTGGRGLSTAW